MKLALISVLALAPCVFAQDAGNAVWYQNPSPVTTVSVAAFAKGPVALVQGAPYSATTTIEVIQTLADGNRIVHTSSGTTSRDSLGRTRQDTALPAIGNLSAVDAPHIVFIQDPITQTSYTLNLTDKTAQKISMSQPPPGPVSPVLPGGPGTFFIQTESVSGSLPPGGLPPLPPGPPPAGIVIQRSVSADEQAPPVTEDLGSQTMEGVLVNGVRTTSTIPSGQIGNDRPISIVTEVWTSPELKTIVYSKRSDPRMGEQIFQLTNIVRTEPDPSLFTVPADFKVVDGPQPIVYRTTK